MADKSVTKAHLFDRRFGDSLLDEAPQSPGVYLYYNVAGDVCYVGKAKNLRRRLMQYRRPAKGKPGAKPRAIVKTAHRLEWRECADELDALICETRLIQEHAPKLNVAHAYAGYYPYFGLREDSGVFELYYTRRPESLVAGVRAFGAFRSRSMCSEVFSTLVELLGYWGHAEQKRARHSRHSGPPSCRFRQLPKEAVDQWSAFFKGDSDSVLGELSLNILENAGARQRAKEVQEGLRLLKAFWELEVSPLARVIERTGFESYPVPQKERDVLFTRARFL